MIAELNFAILAWSVSILKLRYEATNVEFAHLDLSETENVVKNKVF